MPGIAGIGFRAFCLDMNYIPVKRISGTFGERYIFVALPIPALIGMYVVLKNGTEGLTTVGLFIGVGLASIIYWLMDCEAAHHRNPVPLVDGEVLLIGRDPVHPKMIQKITPISGDRRFYGGLIEIVCESHSGPKTASVLSKPGLLGPFAFTSRTLKLLLRSHPELADRVMLERRD